MDLSVSAQLINALKGGAEVIAVVSVPGEYVPKPVWLKLPPRGHVCPVTGLPASTLKDYVLASRRTDHPVVTRHLKQKGKSKGVRLIGYDSLMSYIASQPPWPDPSGPDEEEEGEGSP